MRRDRRNVGCREDNARTKEGQKISTYAVVAEVGVGVGLVVGVEAVVADDVEALGGDLAAVAHQHLVQVLCWCRRHVCMWGTQGWVVEEQRVSGQWNREGKVCVRGAQGLSERNMHAGQRD